MKTRSTLRTSHYNGLFNQFRLKPAILCLVTLLDRFFSLFPWNATCYGDAYVHQSVGIEYQVVHIVVPVGLSDAHQFA